MTPNHINQAVEKLLYSRRDAAKALSLSIRPIDYLIATGRLTTRRIGGKILIPTSAVRRFAREDHPESVRTARPRPPYLTVPKRHSSEITSARFGPQTESRDDQVQRKANGDN
jgi:hypothetical protein